MPSPGLPAAPGAPPLPAAGPLTASEGAADSEVQHVELQDGRRLAYACLGAPLADARLVCIYHHGVPASLIEAEPLAAAGAPLGVALVAFDRPGMGGSTPHPDMSLASVVEDAAQLMDALGLPSAVHIGESGGAPYAAAFAATRPQRTQQLLLVAGLGATFGREYAHLRRGLTSMDRLSMHAKRSGCSWVINRLVKMAADKTPRMVRDGAGGSLGPSDAAFLLGNEGAKDWLLRFMQRAYATGIRGVLRDYAVLGSDWGLDLSAVQTRTAIWHGSGDRIVSPSHAEWYGSTIPGSQLTVVEGEGHISLAGRHGGRILGDALAHAAGSTADTAAAAAASIAGTAAAAASTAGAGTAAAVMAGAAAPAAEEGRAAAVAGPTGPAAAVAAID